MKVVVSKNFQEWIISRYTYTNTSFVLESKIQSIQTYFSCLWSSRICMYEDEDDGSGTTSTK